MKNLKIIYEDNDILVCHKPAGIATQTKRLGQQDMESLLKNYRAKKGEPPYIGIVHRLDQPVEGIMVFTKHQKATTSLSKQIQGKTIGKYYYAISKYKPKEVAGVLEDYLLTDKKTNFTKVADINLLEPEKQKLAKKAKLEYCVVETNEDKTLFDIKLHTGRQHQIRVQMAYMGCPILGDAKYGDGEKGVTLALCSYRLKFLHPITGKKMDLLTKPMNRLCSTFFS